MTGDASSELSGPLEGSAGGGGVSNVASDVAGLVSVIIGATGRPRASQGRPARSGGATAPSAPEEPAQYSWRWEAGRPGPLINGAEGDPDLTLTISPQDARLVKEGQLAPSVAFMQGRLKAAGDNALLLQLLAYSATPAFNAALDEPVEQLGQAETP
jgi:hypothetical protein